MHKNFDEIISEHPSISYQDLRNLLLVNITEEPKPLEQSNRDKLLSRLENMKNPYHDIKHSNEVKERVSILLDNLKDMSIFSERETDLIKEAALRHDDDHVGNSYRQIIVGGELSNEEASAARAIDELRDVATLEELLFVEDLILATTFGQSEKELNHKFPEDEELRKKLLRTYHPNTDAQKLLALADIGGFMSGFESWIADGFSLFIEAGSYPDTIEQWINTRIGFAQGHILNECIPSVKHLLNDEYYEHLTGIITGFIETLNSFKQEGKARDQIIELFEEKRF
eukprot:TRINITY_DN5687_c0_g2_i1.p1 TRINITY_DN5687_c0_g2~~TRINITY_DN5687_c0_g2_i1.p1  ORF type:complete len:285 (+),score=62.73 TRINITY_DN5687_c0_g2_i1:594-1448(+)